MSNTPAASGVDAQVVRNSTRPRIEQALRAEIPFELPDASLDDLALALMKQCDLPVVLDARALAEAGFDPSQPGLRWNSIHLSLGAALHLALRGADLVAVADPDVLRITTRSEAELKTEIRSYPTSGLESPSRAAASCAAEAAADSLIELLTSVVLPATWSTAGGPGSIDAVRGQNVLVVAQTAEAHEQIARLLAMLRDVRKRQFGEQPLKPIPAGQGGELPLRVYTIGAKPPATGSGFFNFDDPLPEQPAAAAPKPDAPKPPESARCEAPAAPAVNPDVALAEQLAKAIPELIEPASWQSAGGKGRIFAAGSRLLVRQTCAVHAQIRQLLAAVAR